MYYNELGYMYGCGPARYPVPDILRDLSRCCKFATREQIVTDMRRAHGCIAKIALDAASHNAV